MNNPNPLHLANTAQQMARSAPGGDGAAFHKIALCCMGVMAVASVLQVLQPILRDLNRRDRDRHHHSRSR